MTFIIAISVASAVFFAGWDLLGARGLKPERRIDAKTLFDLVKLSFGVVAGSGALVALVVAYRRQRVDEDGALRDATRLHNERFTAAVSQLGDQSAAVRLGGVHALAGLADDAPTRDLRQTCIDVLCAYLRLPYTTGDDLPQQGNTDVRHEYMALREVRHTVIRLIRDRLRLAPQHPHSWQGHNLDFTGVVFDGGDLSGATFSGGTVTFKNATFNAGAFSFDEADFSGATVDFRLADFTSGVVTFIGAMFSDGLIDFNGVSFGAHTASFVGARFSGAEVDFQDAYFSSHVSFGSATFADGRVSYIGADFTDAGADFLNARFSGGTVDFSEAMFSGHSTFRQATFSAGTVLFDGVDFSTGSVVFPLAIFSGGTVDFRRATFRGGVLDFADASGDVLPVGLNPLPSGVTLPQAWRSPLGP
ncbi:pentapeptide repeat-containing protein [Streptomyces lushanensis]|uniref:pentapeptide repeat-containing protein n=1 Tax=Streptomyces lushanensis TaxID=1434255 RepID=UPI001FDF4C37|nr:pentapeptide repeat-containing protein [Streptomyces lushanensis]